MADAIDAHKPQKPGPSSAPSLEVIGSRTADDVFFLPMLPFANFVTCLPPRLSSLPRPDLASLLTSRYLSLLDALTDHSRHLHSLPDPPPDIASKISEASYNFLFTEDYMMLVPRTKEKARVGAGHEVSVNSLGFAGMLLVKTREELDAVKEDGVLAALKQVTYPRLPSDYAVGEEPA